MSSSGHRTAWEAHQIFVPGVEKVAPELCTPTTRTRTRTRTRHWQAERDNPVESFAFARKSSDHLHSLREKDC